MGAFLDKPKTEKTNDIGVGRVCKSSQDITNISFLRIIVM